MKIAEQNFLAVNRSGIDFSSVIVPFYGTVFMRRNFIRKCVMSHFLIIEMVSHKSLSFKRLRFN